MYCSECGAAATGSFCARCGARLPTSHVPRPAATPREQVEQPLDLVFDDRTSAPPALPSLHDWANETAYERLLAVPAVRDRIEQAGRRHQPGITGEQYLALFDAVVPTGVSLEKLCVALQPFTKRLGLKTGKSLERTVAAPGGYALVAALCAMASRGHALKHVEQACDGCAFQAVIPSSLWSLTGDLLVSIHARGPSTLIEASTTIGGQMFDWGHSARLLEGLFDGLRQELSELFASPAPGRCIAA